ncbi:MAG: hypothetical protein Q4C30_03115 [Bacteroidia bacterium]|nr:hypothetical protein [Bacteroidia bacterium]
MPTVALIEFNTYHAECIQSQIHYLLSSNYQIVLFCNTKQKNNIECYRELVSDIYYLNPHSIPELLQVRSFIINSNIDNVIFNTAHGSAVLKFCLLPFPKRINFVGTIHNLRKLTDSFGQKLINRRLSAFYVLAKYMKLNAEKYSSLKCAAVSASVTPEASNITIDKKDNEVYLIVPGSIEYKRRDYEYLKEIANFKTDINYKIVLLGNAKKGDGPNFINWIISSGLNDRFIYFNEYVSNEIFNAYMEKCDYLLALIEPNTKAAEDYINYKISGTFIQAISFQKPMLCNAIFKDIKDFNYNGVFYTNTEELFAHIRNHSSTSHVANNDFEENRKEYISLLK